MILNLMATSSQICYNLLCKDPKSDSQRRKGWRIRSGDHAQLCDRCHVAYEQGTFCEIFHADTDGWRKCEACGKRVHCGCVVSASSYVLLDAGGINCVMCARKSLPLGSSNAWPPTLLSYQMSDRSKEQPVRNWSQMAGSYPGQWRQGHLWNTGAQSDLQQRLSLEFDRPLHSERRLAGICPPISTQDKKVGDHSSLNHVKHNTNPTSTCNSQKEEHNNLQESSRPIGENDRSTNFSVINIETHRSSHAKTQSTEPELSGLRGNFSSHTTNDQARISVAQSQQQLGSMMSKQVSMNCHNMNDASVEARAQKSRSDARSQAHLLSRYQPRITDKELQQISGDSNSVITPLFEKILSVSDAGRIGRLVLPKKCAETYFPPITHTEGLPLKVQDCNGKEWALQFRFWPNNKSRMYVLEGITPCIQSMQLVAGDTVTFSRIDPEGKLVMGFRKAAVLPDQDAPLIKTGNGLATASDGNNTAPDNAASVGLQSPTIIPITESMNPASITGHFDKSGNLQKDGSIPQPIQGPKRRGRKLGSKSKRLRINNNDAMELSLTWEEAQGLLRPPPTIIPITVVLDDHEIEEYEEAPVFGKPTIFTSNQAGEINQWAQCDDCFKWRKLPVDALLPSRFLCSVNKWDLERISCSSPQVANAELTDLLHKAGLKWFGPAKPDSLDTAKSLETQNNLGRQVEDESSQQTTKHPRHRPGCTCIVCIQSPSCRGPKHKPTCTCNVCIAVRRRYQSLIQRREKRQSEKDMDAEISNGLDSPLPQNHLFALDNEDGDEGEKRVIVPSMTLMAKIDLNIQPDREEEISPVPDVGSVRMPFADAVV